MTLLNLAKLHYIAAHFTFGLVILFVFLGSFEKSKSRKVLFLYPLGLILSSIQLLSGVSLYFVQGSLKPYQEIHYILGLVVSVSLLFLCLRRGVVHKKAGPYIAVLTFFTIISAFIPDILSQPIIRKNAVSIDRYRENNIRNDLLAQSYFKEVQPIFQNRCYSCHSSQVENGNFNFDKLEDLNTLYFEKYVKRGNPGESILFKYIKKPTFSKYHMPFNSGMLPDREISVIKAWIEKGGLNREQEIQEKKPTTLVNAHWSLEAIKKPVVPSISKLVNEVDRFIWSTYQKEDYDVEFSRVDKRVFLRNLSYSLTGLFPGANELENILNDSISEEDLINRYLNGHHFGENFALFWYDFMALADFRDLYNLDNFVKDSHRYKSYVIKSFNDNTNFIDFFKSQFHEAESYRDIFQFSPRLTAENERYLGAYMTLENLYSSSLGLSFRCARCHDHPYAPFSQSDYFSQLSYLTKFFSIKKIKQMHKDMEFKAKYLSVFNKKREKNEPYNNSIQELAHWITDNENGAGLFFARNFVNAVWSYLFGRGIIRQGEDIFRDPTRPEFLDLLNWLTFYFVEGHYSVKKLVKKMVSSHFFKSKLIFKKSLPERLKVRELKYLEQEHFRDNILNILGRLELKRSRPINLKSFENIDDYFFYGRVDQVDWKKKNLRSIYFPRSRAHVNREFSFVKELDTPKGLKSVHRRRYQQQFSSAFFFLGDGPFSKAAEEMALSDQYFPHKKFDITSLKNVYLQFFSRWPKEDEVRLWKNFFEKKKVNQESLSVFFNILISSNEFNFIGY